MTTTPQIADSVRLNRRLPSPALRRAIRSDAGLTVAEVADAVGVTRQAVNNWERGARSPRGAALRSYVAVLDEIRKASE